MTPRDIVNYFRTASLVEARVTMDFAQEALAARKRAPKKAETGKKPKRKRRTKAEMAAARQLDAPDPGAPPATIGEAPSP